MAYRGDEESADAIEAPTSEGRLRLEHGPRAIRLDVANRSLHIADNYLTLTVAKKSVRLKISGRLFMARDIPREDLGVWMEIDDKKGVGMRRIFGVEPLSLLTEVGLHALPSLDRLAQRLRFALGERSVDVRRAHEMGRGLDKVVLVDHGDRYVLYARKLFRDRARFALAIHTDGRVVVPHGKTTREVTIKSRFGVTVWGDYIRFTDRKGDDVARISVPWIDPVERRELAQRIGNLVDQSG